MPFPVLGVQVSCLSLKGVVITGIFIRGLWGAGAALAPTESVFGGGGGGRGSGLLHVLVAHHPRAELRLRFGEARIRRPVQRVHPL